MPPSTLEQSGHSGRGVCGPRPRRSREPQVHHPKRALTRSQHDRTSPAPNAWVRANVHQRHAASRCLAGTAQPGLLRRLSQPAGCLGCRAGAGDGEIRNVVKYAAIVRYGTHFASATAGPRPIVYPCRTGPGALKLRRRAWFSSDEATEQQERAVRLRPVSRIYAPPGTFYPLSPSYGDPAFRHRLFFLGLASWTRTPKAEHASWSSCVVWIRNQRLSA